MATEGSADFMGPVRPEYSAPTPSFSLSAMPSFITPAMQNFAAAYTPPAPSPKITFQAPPQVSFPSGLADINAPKRDWSVEVLAPSLTSIKPLVTPPKTFEPSTYVSEKANQQIRQATSWAGNNVFSAIEDRISKDSTVLNFIKPIIQPTAGGARQGLDVLAWRKGDWKTEALFLENFAEAQAYRDQHNLPQLSLGSAFDTLKKPTTSNRGTFFMGDPIPIYDAPYDAHYDAMDRSIQAPISLGTQIQSREETLTGPFSYVVSRRDASVSGMLSKPLGRLGYPNAPTPEQRGAEIVKHEGYHAMASPELADLFAMDYDLYGSRTAPAIRDSYFNQPDATTYPEYRFGEYGPAAGAVQEQYIRQSGGTDRLRTPQQTREFLRQYDNLTPEQINSLPVPFEFKRVLMYRFQDRKVNRGLEFLVPAFIQNERPNFVPATA